MPRGAQVVPNNLAKRAFETPRGAGRQTVVQNFNTTVHANDTVMTGWVQREIYQANVQAVQVARKAAAQDSNRTGRQRL